MKTFKKTVAVFLFLLLVTFSERSFSQNVLTYFPETNGWVRAIATHGDTVYIGGSFTTVGGLSRNHLAAINIKTGAVLNWNPNPDQDITSLAVNSNIVYAAGFIATIGGQNRTAIAAIDIISGNVTSWNPVIKSKQPGFYSIISTLVYADNKLFVTGGYIDSINGQVVLPSDNAVIDATTGQLVNWFSPNGKIYTALASNNLLYIGGAFNSILGQSRSCLAAINLSSNTLTNWNLNPDNAINKMILKNGKIYVGGNFSTIGAGFKNGLAYIDTSNGLPGSWNPLKNGNTVNDFVITKDAIYITGKGNPLVSYDLVYGIQKDYWAVGGVLAACGDTVIVGGSFTKVGWVNRNNLFAVTKGLSLGLNEVNNTLQKISVFPNPATNKISFSLNETNSKTLSVIFTNILGETVFNNTLNYQKEIEIPVTDLNNGIYFIKIQSGNNAYAGKFVKE